MQPVPDEDTVRDFLAHTIEVLREASGVASCSDEDRSCVTSGIAISIRVHGDFSGLTWTFPTKLARDTARRMVDGIDPDEDLCIAAAIELANILTGRGLVALEAHNVAARLEPPSLATEIGDGIVANLVTRHGVVEIVFHP